MNEIGIIIKFINSLLICVNMIQITLNNIMFRNIFIKKFRSKTYKIYFFKL